jgi:TetR/AcrR family transcriptional regulator, transcriptional repressor for nem operon
MPIQKITKEEIVHKALKTFNLKGYHDTSIADLAKVCGIKNAHFYYYFKDKEDLMYEVLLYVHLITTNKFKVLLETESISIQEKLIKISQFIEKLYVNNPGGCIMGNTSLEVMGKSIAEKTLYEDSNYKELKFVEVLKVFFESWIGSLQQLFMYKYQENKARELAEATVQDIEGGIMLMRLYQDKKYLLNALRRLERCLD